MLADYSNIRYRNTVISEEDYPYVYTLDDRVTAHCNMNITDEEVIAYIERGKSMWKTLSDIYIWITGQDVELDYIINAQPIERIRRITGYLVGTLDRFNDAKRAEESQRVKHSVGRNQDE